MKLRRALLLVLALVAAAAPAAAACSIPDPTWIGGVYDGADGDEIVALIWDQTPATSSPTPISPRLVAAPLDPVVMCAPPLVARSSSFESRAPPLPLA
jgi:hypothetical protein